MAVFIRPADVVIEAVRDALRVANADLHMLDVEIGRREAALNAVKERREAVEERRDGLLKFFSDNKVSIDDSELTAQPSEETGRQLLRRPSTSERVTARVAEMLKGGRRMKPQAILDELERSGVKLLAVNPQHRISQILSTNPRFVADRVHGWALRTEHDGEPDGLEQEDEEES